MTVKHHPSNETLAAFAAGTLSEGRSIVVATHLSLCSQCRSAVRAFEAVGGAMLKDIEPVSMRADALERTLARLDTPSAVRLAKRKDDTELPMPLSQYEMGAWRRIGRGIELRPVSVPSDNDTRVFLLRAKAGTEIPHHRHTGDEWTCVFQGAFRHEGGRFGPGDFDEADDKDEHRPLVEAGEACICIVALQGNIRFQSWLGRLLQPFVRI